MSINEAASHPKANILVVEDEGIIAINIKTILLQNGYKLAGTARTGEDAVNLVQNIKPDLILMDIMLDGSLNGIQTAERIRRYSNVPVIFLTALTDDETFLNAYKTKPYEYIVKPFREAKLLEVISMALSQVKSF